MDQETLFARWLSGELEPAERQELQDSGTSAELEQIIQHVDELELMPYNLEQAYQSHVLTRTPQKLQAGKSRRLWLVAAAASVAILIGSIFLLQVNTADIVKAPYADQVNHSFEDGTITKLNAGSTISYAAGSWNENRELSLEGEAYFDVRPGASFRVNTPHGHVQVLGTSFNVKSRDNHLEVECYSGKVEVEHGGQKVILAKGRAVSIVDGQFSGLEQITNEAPYWTTGVSRFRSEPLRDVFSEMERQFDVQISTADLDRHFSGAFSHRDLNQALDQVCKPMKLQYELTETNQVIISK